MLVGRFYKPSDKMLFITLLGFVILSLVIILFNSFIYLEVIIVNIMVFCLLSIFFKEFFFYSLNWIVILLLLLHTWETIDIKLNNFKYYYSFEPLTKYECLAAYNLDKNEISQNVHCKYGLSNNEKEEINTYMEKNKDLIKHLKKLGCHSIEFSEKYIQFWYDDIVIDLKKIDDNTIVYETNGLK
jgi:hypothetical protein